MSPPLLSDLGSELGPDGRELLRLIEQDYRQHEGTLAEHHRTAITIRGFAVTAVAALIAGGYASHAAEPEWFAVAAVWMFLFVDYYYVSLSTPLLGRLRILVSLSDKHRRLLAKSGTADELDDFRGDLRTYDAGPVSPSSRSALMRRERLDGVKLLAPGLLRRLHLPATLARPGGYLPEAMRSRQIPVPWPLGRLKAFVPLYVVLFATALTSAFLVKPAGRAEIRLEVVCVYAQPPRLGRPPDPIATWKAPCPPIDPFESPGAP